MKHFLAIVVGMIMLAVFGVITWMMAYKPEWINFIIGVGLMLFVAYVMGIKVIDGVKR